MMVFKQIIMGRILEYNVEGNYVILATGGERHRYSLNHYKIVQDTESDLEEKRIKKTS